MCRAESFRVDCQGPLIEGFGLDKLSGVSIQLCQIVEGLRDVGVRRPEDLLSDRQGSLIQGLGLRIPPGGVIQDR